MGHLKLVYKAFDVVICSLVFSVFVRAYVVYTSSDIVAVFSVFMAWVCQRYLLGVLGAIYLIYTYFNSLMYLII